MAYISALTFDWIARFRNAMDLAQWTLPLANWYSWTPNEIGPPDRCSTLGNFPQDSIFRNGQVLLMCIPKLITCSVALAQTMALTIPAGVASSFDQTTSNLQSVETLEAESIEEPVFWMDPRVRDRSNASQRVVVWFNKQLLGDGEAYLRRTRQLANAQRTTLRQEAIQKLKETSDHSYSRAGDHLNQLVADGVIENIQRHWIVNGISLTLAPNSTERLQAIPGVSRVFAKRRNAIRPEKKRPSPKTRSTRSSEDPHPFSTDRYQHPWYIRHLMVDRVWRELGVTGQGTLNVIQDQNFVISPNTAANLYCNVAEIPGNHIDDDENGRIDDVHGFDFDLQRGNLTRQTVPVSKFSPQLMHGHACALIVCGRGTPDSPFELGVAPESKWAGVMAGADFEQAIEWAIEQQADTYSMSFSIPNLGELRSHYRKVMEHGSLCGVFFVSGAGNFAQEGSPQYAAPPVQMRTPEDIPEVVFAAAGIQRDLSRTPFSSQGPVHWETEHYRDGAVTKPEVCAFNAAIPTLLSNGEVAPFTVNGNSFAGPMFCGTIALMLSADPELLPWDLKQIVTDTALDVGPEGDDPQTGHGLINAYRAVKEVLRRKAIREGQDPTPYTSQPEGDELDIQRVLKNLEGRRLVVSSIQPNSQWMAAGLQQDDVIEQVNEVKVASWLDFRSVLQDSSANGRKTVKIQLNRDGKQMELTAPSRPTGLQLREDNPQPDFE